MGAFEDSLELVATRAGDPTDPVYERLFARHPELEALFVGDATRQARGQMLTVALETLGDLAAGRPWAANMIRAERVNHDQLGVPDDVFATFFGVVHAVFRDLAGSDWTREMEADWVAALAAVEAT
ncbi:globin domain-containing protein [Caulobacter mirabilis]|uniref:Globin n=1 Tax=Caulobacter mirabilis TaxID=69666 RepID=A0A2D2ATG5_9CAUL|nr:globin domain-containing protein [Caulobacter mirabilis]ATQ41300.1 globin [Caulobacter mirabilis]